MNDSFLLLGRCAGLMAGMCFLAVPSFALGLGKAISQYRQDVWTEQSGLPQSSVLAITQTRDGYLWIGTRDGLARFDGVAFTVFDADHHSGLAANDIRSLYEDDRGRLWIGTFNGGVSCYEDGKFTRYGAADGLPSEGVLDILQDQAGTFWMGTWDGVARVDSDGTDAFRAEAMLGRAAAWSVGVDSTGAIWVGTARGLIRIAGEQREYFTTQNGLRSNLVREVYADRDGSIWIGTIGGGLSRYADGRFQHFTTEDGLADNRVRTVLRDSKGILWIGTWGGLSRFHEERISSYTVADGLPHPIVEALYEDSEGSLWVGTRGGGLARLRDGKFVVYTTKEGLCSDAAKSVFQSSDGSLWIGSNGGGVSRFKDGKFVTYTTEDGLLSNHVRAICEDAEGRIWVGTGRPTGLSRFEGDRFTSIGNEDGLGVESGVRALFVDRAGDMWIGGDTGALCRYRNGTFTSYTTADGLPSVLIRVIAQDRQGDLWFGTERGLTKYRDGKFTVHTTADGLSHNAVYTIHEDGEGTLWLGTQRGLTRYRNGEFTKYTTRDGLHQNLIFQILEDDQRNLWMSSNRGIARVGIAELEAFEPGTGQRIECTVFGVADGLKTAQCEGGTQPAGWKTEGGMLWFPTASGVAAIHPGRIQLNDYVPPVHIESFTVGDEQVDMTQAVRLKPGARDFRFRYTALSFVAPEKVQFKFKLEGFDQDWFHAGTRRFAVYNDIPPGSYRFRVIACNNDGVWNETGAGYAFSLAPYFYETTTFYLVCIALIGVAAWSFHRHRMRQAQAEFSIVLAERSRIARELHDTLAQGFAGIAFQLEAVATKLTEAPAQAQEHLNLALTMVRHSLAEARRSVMNLRSAALEKGDLATAIAESGRQICGDRHVELEVITEGNPRPLPPNIENNLLRVGQEAVTNAMRHGHPRSIQVCLSYHADRIALRIVDDGAGFSVDESNASDGVHFGLLGMRERAKQMGARLDVKSCAGSGTEIAVEVPLKANVTNKSVG